jgi:hypothetical protein
MDILYFVEQMSTSSIWLVANLDKWLGSTISGFLQLVAIQPQRHRSVI